MHPLKLSAAILALLAFAGCATNSQKQWQYTNEALAEVVSEMERCTNAVRSSNPEPSSRLSNITLSGFDDPKTIQKMTIDRYMTESEKADVLQLKELTLPCEVATLEGASKIHPDLVTIFATRFSKSDERTIALIQDKITIGESNVMLKEYNLQASKEGREALKNIQQQLTQSHNAEMANRQAAINSLQQWNYQQQQFLLQNQQNQQMINAINKPTTTNCSYIGNTLNCQSF